MKTNKNTSPKSNAASKTEKKLGQSKAKQEPATKKTAGQGKTKAESVEKNMDTDQE